MIITETEPFESDNLGDLSEEINEWLSEDYEDDFELIDIKFNQILLGDSTIHYAAILIYKTSKPKSAFNQAILDKLAYKSNTDKQ